MHMVADLKADLAMVANVSFVQSKSTAWPEADKSKFRGITSSQERNLNDLRNFADAGIDYGAALGMSWLFYEAQRAGPLPSTNKILWNVPLLTEEIC